MAGGPLCCSSAEPVQCRVYEARYMGVPGQDTPGLGLGYRLGLDQCNTRLGLGYASASASITRLGLGFASASTHNTKLDESETSLPYILKSLIIDHKRPPPGGQLRESDEASIMALAEAEARGRGQAETRLRPD